MTGTCESFWACKYSLDVFFQSVEVGEQMVTNMIGAMAGEQVPSALLWLVGHSEEELRQGQSLGTDWVAAQFPEVLIGS